MAELKMANLASLVRNEIRNHALTLETNLGSMSANPLERFEGAMSMLETAMMHVFLPT